MRARLTAVLSYDKQAKVHVGYAPALKIYSHAPTEERAKRTLASAVALFLAAAHNNPSLAAILPEAASWHVSLGKSLDPPKFDDLFAILASDASVHT